MNWKKVKLGDICKFLSGFAWSAKNFKEVGKIPIIRIQNMCSNKPDDFIYWDEKYDEKFIIKKNDLLLSLSGSIKIDYWKGVNALFNQRIVKITPNDDVDDRWFFWQMLNELKKIEKMGKWALVNNVSITDLKNLEIPLPHLATQKHIAEVLDKADALRQQNRQLLANYDELLQSTFIEIFSDKNKDFTKWDLKKIEEIVENRKGSMRSGPFGSDLLHSEFVDSGIFVLGIDNVVNNKFEWARMRYITEEKYQKLKRYTVTAGDLLISIMATVGRVAIVPENMPLAINSKHLAAITLDKNIVEPVFIAYNLHSNPEVKRQISARGRGAIMEGLNLGLIRDIKVKVPPLALQQHFAKIVEQIEAQKAEAQAALVESEALFEGLLAGYFNA